MEWISVKERLPEDEQEVLYFCSIGIEKGKYKNCCFMLLGIDAFSHFTWIKERYAVTHWQPLPDPPKGE